MSEPKTAKQMSTTLDDGRRGTQDRLQLRQNGHDVRGQLAQNAQFKARMMAQMKAPGRAVQRKEDASAEQWESTVRAIIGTGLKIDNAEDACAVLHFVWPKERITLRHCQSPAAIQFAGEILGKMVNASETSARLPRAVALGMITTGWLTRRVISAVSGSGDATGIALRSVDGVRSGYRIRMKEVLGMANSGAFTHERGLGF